MPALAARYEETLQPVQASVWLKQPGNRLPTEIPRTVQFRQRAENESFHWRISQK
jgi:hypothetical protein